jgi:hypothetical protein
MSDEADMSMKEHNGTPEMYQRIAELESQLTEAKQCIICAEEGQHSAYCEECHDSEIAMKDWELKEAIDCITRAKRANLEQRVTDILSFFAYIGEPDEGELDDKFNQICSCLAQAIFIESFGDDFVEITQSMKAVLKKTYPYYKEIRYKEYLIDFIESRLIDQGVEA